MIRSVARLPTGTLEDCNCSINLKGINGMAAKKKKKGTNRNKRWCVYKGTGKSKRRVSCHRLKRAAQKAAKAKGGRVLKGPSAAGKGGSGRKKKCLKWSKGRKRCLRRSKR